MKNLLRTVKINGKAKVDRLTIQYGDDQDNYIDLEGGASQRSQFPNRENSNIIACMFPASKKEPQFEEEKDLQKYLRLMIILHGIYILLELFIYSALMMVMFEIPRMWLAYYSYMTIAMCPTYSYMTFLFIGGVFNVLTYFTVLISFDILSILIFPFQLFLMVYSAYLLWIKIGLYNIGKRRFEGKPELFNGQEAQEKMRQQREQQPQQNSQGYNSVPNPSSGAQVPYSNNLFGQAAKMLQSGQQPNMQQQYNSVNSYGNNNNNNQGGGGFDFQRASRDPDGAMKQVQQDVQKQVVTAAAQQMVSNITSGVKNQFNKAMQQNNNNAGGGNYNNNYNSNNNYR